MKSLFAIAFFLLHAAVNAQTDKVISVIVTSKGNQKSMRLEFEAIDKYRGIKSVEPGKLRFYMSMDNNCKITLNRTKGTAITPEEADELERTLSEYTIQYTIDGVKITDCASLSSESFPISVTTVRN